MSQRERERERMKVLSELLVSDRARDEYKAAGRGEL